MEKFKMQVAYQVAKTSYITNQFETEHFRMDCTAFKDHIVLKMRTPVPVKIQSLSITIPYEFKADDRLFLNGYQSWTDCREYFPDDKPSYLSPVFKPFIMMSSFRSSGDYTFVEYATEPGHFHGFSYGYVRRGAQYDLFASLNERTGYTIFRFNAKENTIVVEKDLDGIAIDGEYTVLDIVNLQGTMDEVFDKWFALLKIPKATAPVYNGYTTWYNYYPNINDKIVTQDLEALSKVDTVVFDKTGTLTQGRFEVTAVHAQEMSEAELLDIAALAESYSNHPIALSIIKAHGGHLDRSRVSSIEESSGYGVTAVIDGKKVSVGNDKLMHRAGVQWKDCHLPGTTVHIAADGVYMGHIVISDTVKPDAKEAILALKNNGVRKTVMLTGDNKKNGEAVAAELGLDEAKTQLLPDEKVAAVEELLQQKPDKRTLAFVGDGINDAPVLARADVGIAMGALGSDAAIEAADIVLMDDRLTGLSKAMRISRKTMRIVHQNIVFSLLVKLAVLVLGALGLANMWFAVFADVGVMILAILNAMRALHIQK